MGEVEGRFPPAPRARISAMTTAQRAGSQIAENLRLSLSTALHSTAIIIRAIGAVPQWQPSGEGGDQGAFLGVMPSSQVSCCIGALCTGFTRHRPNRWGGAEP